MNRILIALVCVVLCAQRGYGQNKLEFAGYLKDLVSAIHIKETGTSWDNLLHNRSVLAWNADTAWTFRAELRTRLFYGDQVKSPLFDDLIEATANDIVDLSIGTRFGDRGYVHSYFDRLYMQYTRDRIVVRIGRQRINWGINTLWNPNDLFNAYAFTDFDYEERPGSDGVRIQYYTGDLSSIEVVLKAGNNEKEGAIAALWRTHLGAYDLQFLGGYLTQSDQLVFGGGWAGNLKNWSFKGEGSVFVPNEKNENVGAALSMGWEYVFPGEVLLGFGGLYNALGRTSGSLQDLFAFDLSARNLYPFRWTVNVSTGFMIHPLVSGSLTTVYSIASSHPVFLSPAITWSAKQSLDIDLVGQFVLNEDTGQYTSPVQAGFLRVKWSY